MTSGSFFFKLVRENIKQRLWMLALSIITFFFAFPVAALLMESGAFRYAKTAEQLFIARKNFYEGFMDWAGRANSVLSAGLVIFAGIAAVSGFSYLHSAKQSDFYHSIPVKRGTLFASVNAASFVIIAAPYLICVLISALYVKARTGFSYCVLPVLLHFAGNLCFMFFSYMLTVFAMMLTGKVTVGILGAVSLTFFIPASAGLIYAYMTMCLRTVYEGKGGISGIFSRICQYSSPFILTFDLDTPLSKRVPAAFLCGLLFTFLSLVLYRKRNLEYAEKAMAFPCTRGPVRTALSVISGLSGGLFMELIMGSPAWDLFGIITGTVISSLVIEIIFESDFKKMFAHKIWLILGLMIALLFYGGMRFDILGYDRYIPKERRIDRAYVYTDTFGNVSDLNADFELTGKEGSRYARIVPETSEEVFSESAFPVETVRKIAEKGAEDTVNLKNNQMDSGSIGDACFRDVLVSWKLDNGRRIFRKYSMDLSSVKEELDAIHDSEEFRKAAYPVLLQKPEEIVSINYRNFGGIETIKGMSKEQTARLLYAYQSELSALTADTRRQESPVAAVQFQTKKMKDAIDCLLTDNIYYMPFNDYFYYPVYPSFTKTISVLSEAGVILNEALLPENIERISLSQMKIADETTGDLIITDPEQIKQVLSAIVPTNLPCDNRYLPVYYGIAISTELYKEPAAGRDGYMNYVFDAAKIPDFVKEHFRLTEEEISRDSEKSY